MRKKNSFGFVKFPECGKKLKYYHSGENGCEVWLVTRPSYKGVRNICSGDFFTGLIDYNAAEFPDEIESIKKFQINSVETIDNLQGKKTVFKYTYNIIPLDCMICLGASKKVPISRKDNNYWMPKYKDLTKEGRKIYKMIKFLYKIEPSLVLAIDT